MYTVTKTYGPEQGLSACFRQWRAESHCRHLHGYALSIELEFSATVLNQNNWVIDFGGLKPIKAWLQDTFDHKLLVAEDDPELDTLTGLAGLGLADVLVIPDVGCEAYAQMIFDHICQWLVDEQGDAIHRRKLRLERVTVREHSGNAASYLAPKELTNVRR